MGLLLYEDRDFKVRRNLLKSPSFTGCKRLKGNTSFWKFLRYPILYFHGRKGRKRNPVTSIFHSFAGERNLGDRVPSYESTVVYYSSRTHDEEGST